MLEREGTHDCFSDLFATNDATETSWISLSFVCNSNVLNILSVSLISLTNYTCLQAILTAM